MNGKEQQFWRYVQGFAAPLLLWCLFVGVLVNPLQSWLEGDEKYDAAAMQEWIENTRGFHDTLPEMARDYLTELDRTSQDDPGQKELQQALKAEKISEHLKSLGNVTKVNSDQLPLFPKIYRFTLSCKTSAGDVVTPITWDSGITRHAGQFRELDYAISARATLKVLYQLHAFNKQQRDEKIANSRLRLVAILAIASTVLALVWMFVVQHREREYQRHRGEARQQLDVAERLRLEEELKRREAERKHEEIERTLLEQRVATQAAEQQALELKSQLYASISIMAGSYAHNIKNLLVRPNDLLRRCMEVDGIPADQEHMLREVRQTLGTVTERLQQILRTVRRDPNRAEMTRLDLSQIVLELKNTWVDLAKEKWKVHLTADMVVEPLLMEGDLSHLQQAIENLLFNARDATFEMRNHLRDEARRNESLSDEERRHALIAAAAWKGEIVLRTHRQEGKAVLAVQDNGIGMTEEIRRRCTETHFTTKRDNAIYEGNSTGMGLGLSFVVVILNHHHSKLEIRSEPWHGAIFTAAFPLAE